MATENARGSLDMTMMVAAHNAFRRDLKDIAASAAAAGDEPARLYAAHFGWELFKQFLTVHHTTEDTALWPRMRELCAGSAERLELLEAMEREHDRIDPLIAAVDEALADQEGGYARLGDVTDALVAELGHHLDHEEADALPLVDLVLPAEEWQALASEQRSAGPQVASVYLPWLLDDASPEMAEQVQSRIPPHLREIYATSWKQSYEQRNPWSPGHAR